VRIRPPRAEPGPRAGSRLHFGLLLFLAYAVWFAGFELVGRYARTLHTLDLTTALDRAIPLVPAFIWPYEACYLLPLCSLWVIRDWHRFNVGLIAILLASLIAFVFYLLLPVAFPRPPLGGSLAERILAAEYAADFSPGANKLPSLHVAIAWILLFAVWGQARRRIVDVLALGLVAAVSVSTLFVKQHLLLDVATALPLAMVSFALARRIYWGATDPAHPPETALWHLLVHRSVARLPERGQS
jgi:hypothetical protein